MPFTLHTQMQDLYAGEDGEREVRLEETSFVADVVRDGVIYEIQTRNIRSIRTKITTLLDDWPVVIVHPVVRNTVIVYGEGNPHVEHKRRKSPKRGTPLDAFDEAVSLAKLLRHPNLALEIPVVSVEDLRVRCTDEDTRPRRRRRRRRRKEWTTVDRRMTELHDTVCVDVPSDGLRLLPESLPCSFTSAMLAEVTRLQVYRARRVTYTLHHAGALVRTHKTRDGFWYERTA